MKKYIVAVRRTKKMDREKLLTVKEASEILGINYKTLYQWSWMKKHLPFIKIGKALRISEKDITQFMDSNKSMPK